MYAPLEIVAKYLRYYLTASNGKGHGIHSPFVFDFITQVLNDKTRFDAYSEVERRREELLKDNRVLMIDDFGAGSVSGHTKQRSVSAIARNAAKPKKWGQLLFRIARFYKPGTMLELGTSLGLSAAYLAKGNTSAQLITCEGAGTVAAVARENFSLLGIKNISTIEGNFDETLPGVVDNHKQIGLGFIDGNHRKEPTLRYFHQLLPAISYPGILIFDDIHWSKDMEAAWEEIKAHPASMLTVDLFFIGLVFFSADFKVKQHFVIRF